MLRDALRCGMFDCVGTVIPAPPPTNEDKMSKSPKTYSNEIDREAIESMHPDAFRVIEQASGWIVFFGESSFNEWDSLTPKRKRA